MGLNEQKKKKNRKVVYFDEEIVTKDSAGKLLSNEHSFGNHKSESEGNTDKQDVILKQKNAKRDVDNKKKKKKTKKSETNEPIIKPDKNDFNLIDAVTKVGIKKRKKEKEKDDEISLITAKPEQDESNVHIKKKKRKKNNVTRSEIMVESVTEVGIKKKRENSNVLQETEEPEKNDEVSSEKPNIKREESIRERKRKKHAKLIEEKRLKVELDAQQGALNYISMWKYNREEWKFEKLKQIWLQQNLFDSSKIPAEFWGTVMEYFCGSKGSVRTVTLKKAIEIIEKEEEANEENTDENYLLILKRAREVVQNLQE